MAREPFLSFSEHECSSFTLKDSIMIALIVTTPCFVTDMQAETFMSSFGMAFIPDAQQNDHSAVSGEWRDLSDYMQPDIFVWPTFTLFQNSHHTQPPQTRYFKFPKENKSLYFSATIRVNADAAFFWAYTC